VTARSRATEMRIMATLPRSVVMLRVLIVLPFAARGRVRLGRLPDDIRGIHRARGSARSTPACRAYPSCDLARTGRPAPSTSGTTRAVGCSAPGAIPRGSRGAEGGRRSSRAGATERRSPVGSTLANEVVRYPQARRAAFTPARGGQLVEALLFDDRAAQRA